MPVETKLALRGLSRDVNGYVADQAGALRRAENVVLRAQDTAESRPNFDMYYESVFTSQRCKALVEFGGEPIAVEFDGSTWGLRRLSTNTGYVNGSLAQPVNYDQAEPQFAEAKGCLFGLGSKGVYKLEAVTDTTNGLRLAGLDMVYATDMVQGNFATKAYCWAYCFVYVHTDSLGNVIRSPPSDRIVMTADNPMPSTFLGTRFYFNPALVKDDQVEVYRTRITPGSTPTPTMYLAFAYTLTTADVAAGYFVPPTDNVLDANLGAELYTNSTQQGITAAKYAPPQAQAIAWWGRVMWYGRTQSKNRLTCKLLDVGPAGVMTNGGLGGAFSTGGHFTGGSPIVTGISTASLSKGQYFTDNLLQGPTAAGSIWPANTKVLSVDSSTQATMTNNAAAGSSLYMGVMNRSDGPGPTYLSMGGTFTSGSAIVTGITSTIGLRAGMYITDSASGPTVGGAKVPTGRTIQSVDSANQVTMSGTASASGTVTFYAGDIITVNTSLVSVPFYAWTGLREAATGPWAWPAQCFDATATTEGYLAIAGTVTSLAMAVNYYAIKNSSTFKVRMVPFGDTNRDDVLVSTMTASFALEELGVGQTAVSLSATCATAFAPQLSLSGTNDAKPNRLWWSAPDEPEAVPLLNYQDIGSSSEPILALVPLRNALLVFKTDGIWRVTGSAPSSWSIEPLDLAIRLLRPEAVTNIGDGAYAWCDRGMFLVTDSGAQSLSSNAIDVELRTAANYILTNATTHGTFMVPWKARNLVLFGIPAAAAGTTTQRVYAFSTVTNAFSEWPVSWSVACHGDGDAVYYSRPYDGTVLYEVRKSVTAVRGYDRLYVISSATAVGTTVTISQSITGAWEPAVGDILTAIVGGDPTYGRRITAVASGGGNWTLTIESAFPAGSTSGWTAYEVPVITLEWHPTAVSGLPMGGFCREMQVHLDLRDAGSRISGTIPTSWALGGTSEAVTTPSTVTSTRALTAQIQPIRVGMSRKAARGAALAGYFSAGDLFPIRVLGASLVFDGTNERTRK